MRSSRARRAVARVALPTAGDQVVGGALEEESAFVHEDDVGAGGDDVLDEVGGDHHTAVDAEVTQQVAEVETLFGVESDGGLVEQ